MKSESSVFNVSVVRMYVWCAKGADESQHPMLVFLQCTWSNSTQDLRCEVS